MLGRTLGAARLYPRWPKVLVLWAGQARPRSHSPGQDPGRGLLWLAGMGTGHTVMVTRLRSFLPALCCSSKVAPAKGSSCSGLPAGGGAIRAQERVPSPSWSTPGQGPRREVRTRGTGHLRHKGTPARLTPRLSPQAAASAFLCQHQHPGPSPAALPISPSPAGTRPLHTSPQTPHRRGNTFTTKTYRLRFGCSLQQSSPGSAFCGCRSNGISRRGEAHRTASTRSNLRQAPRCPGPAASLLGRFRASATLIQCQPSRPLRPSADRVRYRGLASSVRLGPILDDQLPAKPADCCPLPPQVSPPELLCYGAVRGQCVSTNRAEDRLQILLISGLQMRAGFTRLSVSSLHLDNQKAPLSPHSTTASPHGELSKLNASTVAAVSPGPCSEPMSQPRCCTGLCKALSPPRKEAVASPTDRQALEVLGAGAARCVSWRAPSQLRNTLAWESPGAGRAQPAAMRSPGCSQALQQSWQQL